MTNKEGSGRGGRVATVSSRITDPAILMALVGLRAAPTAAQLNEAQRNVDIKLAGALEIAHLRRQGLVSHAVFIMAEGDALIADHQLNTLIALVQ